MMRIAVISLTIAFCLSIGIADAQNISDEAMRHFDRGQAAVEMAKSTTDYEDAIKEFEKAAKLAPDWPDVYYNLGLIQEKLSKYEDAIKNLTKYLKLSPNASDSREVKKFVAKMEYRLEKVSEAAKIRSWLEGEWTGAPGPPVSTQWPVRFIVNDDSVNMYAPITWNMSDAVHIDYETISIKQEGRKIQFSVVLKGKMKDRRGLLEVIWKEKAQYNLTLITPDKMEGTKVSSLKIVSTGEINKIEKISHFWKKR